MHYQSRLIYMDFYPEVLYPSSLSYRGLSISRGPVTHDIPLLLVSHHCIVTFWALLNDTSSGPTSDSCFQNPRIKSFSSPFAKPPTFKPVLCPLLLPRTRRSLVTDTIFLIITPKIRMSPLRQPPVGQNIFFMSISSVKGLMRTSSSALFPERAPNFPCGQYYCVAGPRKTSHWPFWPLLEQCWVEGHTYPWEYANEGCGHVGTTTSSLSDFAKNGGFSKGRGEPNCQVFVL